MILYVWIDRFKNLENIGFNLTSRFHFDFILDQNDASKKTGELVYSELSRLGVFDNFFWDLKAIIGKNGSGKSSLILSIIQNILSDHPNGFNGFIVTDKYIFNRKGFNINHSIKIESTPLIEIKNAEICNYLRDFYQRKLTEDEARTQAGYKIIDTFLEGHAIFHYSPLVNYDSIYESETAIAGHGSYVVDGHKFFDISTEALIVNDSHAFAPFEYMDIKAESEILCHKSRESERVLEYLLEQSLEIPFDIKIPLVRIHLNQFSINFWDVVSRYFKADDEIYSPLTRIVINIESKIKTKDDWTKFENGLIKRMLYFLLRYEVNFRYNFGDYKESNGLIHTIKNFERISSKQKSMLGLLKNYVTKSDVFKDDFSQLFTQIHKFLKFLHQAYKQKKISVDAYSFHINFSEKKLIRDILNFTHGFHGYRKGHEGLEKVSISFPVFSYEFGGLSAGEKSYLHLLSRFHHSIKFISPSTKDVVIFLDEPEIAFHPQWQKEFITIVSKFFRKRLSNYRCQLIITGHSPIIISDLPSENIVFLDTHYESGKPFIANLINTTKTFGANIHSLYADAFFIQNGTIGQFAKDSILNAVTIIKNREEKKKAWAFNIIEQIGDPLVRQRLMDLYTEYFGKKLESPEEQLKRLEFEIEFLKSKMNETSK